MWSKTKKKTPTLNKKTQQIAESGVCTGKNIILYSTCCLNISLVDAMNLHGGLV